MLAWLTELPAAAAPVELGLEPDCEPVALPEAAAAAELDVGGATAESALIVLHCAAELALEFPWVYGKKETAPLLAS